MHCPICSADRDRLDEMQFELDNLLLKLSSTVKAYDSCDDDIHAIVVLSKRMRHCNHDLLSRLISHEFDDEDAVMPELVIGDLDTESRERGIESRENGEMPRSAWKPSEEDEEEREHAIEQAREGAIEEHNDNMAD
jgi:formyltetrahydrofolate hydrolase